MSKNPNKCIVKWCESTDTVQTGIGPVCEKHMYKEPQEIDGALLATPFVAPSDPNTLGISVAEEIKSGDRLA